MVHTAVKIGQWIFEWSISGLVAPCKISADTALNALIVLDIGKISVFDFLHKHADSLSNLLTVWNCQREYNSLKHNCQHFVDEVISILGLKINYEGSLGDYLTAIRTRGPQEKYFRNPQGKEITFKSHKQLDQYVRDYFQKNPEKNKEIDPDYLLLKCFDRVFWLRYHNSVIKSEEDSSDDDCFFNDPSKHSDLIDISK